MPVRALPELLFHGRFAPVDLAPVRADVLSLEHTHAEVEPRAVLGDGAAKIQTDELAGRRTGMSAVPVVGECENPRCEAKHGYGAGSVRTEFAGDSDGARATYRETLDLEQLWREHHAPPGFVYFYGAFTRTRIEFRKPFRNKVDAGLTHADSDVSPAR